MTAMEFCRNGFLRLRYPRSLMPMYCLVCVVWCMVYGVRCLMRREYSHYAKYEVVRVFGLIYKSQEYISPGQ